MLTRPQLQPDEIDRSYLGAVMRFNGLGNDAEAKARMALWAVGQKWTPETTPVVELLSRIAGVTPQHFIQHHTTLPFRRAISSTHRHVPHTCIDDRSLLSRSGTRQVRPAAWFCAECVVSDQVNQGRSYWRREHQMPGVYWCSKHRLALRFVEEPAAMCRPPSAFVDRSGSVGDVALQSFRDSEAVARFVDICCGLLDTKSSIDSSVVRQILRVRAASLGYAVPSWSRPTATAGRSLNVEIRQSFPESWLHLEFPFVMAKRQESRSEGIDGVFMGGKALAVGTYALVASVLFKSSNEALDRFTVPSPKRPARVRGPLLKRSTKDWRLRQFYASVRGDYTAIRAASGAEAPFIVQRLATLGLPDLEPQSGQSLLVAAKAFFVGGLSVVASAKAGKIELSVLENALRQGASDLQRAIEAMSAAMAE